VVAFVQVPVPANNNPTLASPALEDALAIKMTPNSLVTTPVPTWPLLNVVALPQVPIGSAFDPTATLTVMNVQSAETIQVATNALVAAPPPTDTLLGGWVVVFPVQVPVPADDNPTFAIPALEDAQAVEMAPHLLELPPEPTTRTIIMITLPHMPVGAYMPPVSVPEAAQNAATVHVMSDTLVLTPEPPIFAMELVAVMVFSPQLPVPAFHDPLGTSPALEDSTSVQVIANSLETTPAPAGLLVVVVAAVQVPVCPNTFPASLHIAVQGSQAVTV